MSLVSNPGGGNGGQPPERPFLGRYFNNHSLYDRTLCTLILTLFVGILGIVVGCGCLITSLITNESSGNTSASSTSSGNVGDRFCVGSGIYGMATGGIFMCIGVSVLSNVLFPLLRRMGGVRSFARRITCPSAGHCIRIVLNLLLVLYGGTSFLSGLLCSSNLTREVSSGVTGLNSTSNNNTTTPFSTSTNSTSTGGITPAPLECVPVSCLDMVTGFVCLLIFALLRTQIPPRPSRQENIPLVEKNDNNDKDQGPQKSS